MVTQEPAGPRRACAKRSVSCRWLRMVKKDAQEFGRPAAHKIPEVFGTRLHPHASGQAFHHHRSDRVRPSWVLETLNSSGRSPFYKFVVQQIKKAGPRTDSAAKAEPTSPSRRSSRRPHPLSAPGLAGSWRASRAPKPTHFVRSQRASSRSAPRRCAPRCITASDGWKCLRVDAISIESCDWWSVQLTSTACADYDAQCRPRQRDRP